jgi:subtilisin family serine protease
MTTRAYAFIELDQPPRPGSSRFQQLAAETDDRGPRLLVEAMDDRDVQDRMRSDRYVVHAPEIPIQAIAPVAAAGGGGRPPDETCSWGIKAVGADTCEYDGSGVTVAILDSGIDLEHAAFAPIRDRIEVTDYSGAGPGDGTGHGTHCAGTICGADVGGVRIGIARNLARLLVGRVFDGSGRASSIGLFRGIQDAITAKAQVLSMSLGFDFPGLVERLVDVEGYPMKLAAARALNDLMANVRLFDTYAQLAERMVPMTGGTLIVAAAGNESTPSYRLPVALPAAAERVVSVGAIASSDEGYRVASFSNTPPSVCAPGVDITSAIAGTPSDLGRKSGTSMATPHVAAVAALWFQALRSNATRALAPMVAMRMTQACRTAFARDVALAERGYGVVWAP